MILCSKVLSSRSRVASKPTEPFFAKFVPADYAFHRHLSSEIRTLSICGSTYGPGRSRAARRATQIWSITYANWRRPRRRSRSIASRRWRMHCLADSISTRVIRLSHVPRVVVTENAWWRTCNDALPPTVRFVRAVAMTFHGRYLTPAYIKYVNPPTIIRRHSARNTASKMA